MTRLDILNRVKKISGVQNDDAGINDAIQTALNRVQQWFDWPFYMQQGIINTVALYNTGTAKVTQGSTSVTGVGTTFTSAMVGRKFRHANENAYYVISAVGGATSLTLKTPYQGTTDSTGSSYTIYKDEYRMAADVDKYKASIQIQNGIALKDYPISDFDEVFPTPLSYTDPLLNMMVGTKLDTYTTGTISASASSNIITGNGTLWTTVEGLGRMSNIVVGSARYTVKSVDGDTQITVYETISPSISSGTTYTISLNNLVLSFYPIPDSNRNIYYRYFRIPDILANDYDIPDMPNQFHWLLKFGALSEIYLEKGDVQKAQQEAESRFMDGLNLMKLKIGSFSNNLIYRRKSVDRLPRNFDGLEASNYDIKYSRL